MAVARARGGRAAGKQEQGETGSKQKTKKKGGEGKTEGGKSRIEAVEKAVTGGCP